MAAARGVLARRWLAAMQPVRYALAAGAAALLRLIPLDLADAAFGRFGRAVGPWLAHSRRAHEALGLAFPDMSPARRAAIVAGMWDNLARVVVEYVHLDTILREADQRVEIAGAEHLDALREDGRPGLLFSAHLASWEMVTVAALMRRLPVQVVYRNANNRQLDALIRRLQAVSGAELIRKGPRGARRLMEVMRQGGHVVLLVDQKMNDGIAVPFFGRPAMTAPALAQLAYRFDCPVVPVHVERLAGAHFRVVVDPPLALPRSGDRAADIRAVMTEVNRRVEGWVAARPEHWLWLHRRWPKGTGVTVA